jgi:hypothetical protein
MVKYGPILKRFVLKCEAKIFFKMDTKVNFLMNFVRSSQIIMNAIRVICHILGISLLSIFFYFLLMKVLISCMKNPKKFIEALDKLELFIDKKVIFDEI